jgi:hypothetical protein
MRQCHSVLPPLMAEDPVCLIFASIEFKGGEYGVKVYFANFFVTMTVLRGRRNCVRYNVIL